MADGIKPAAGRVSVPTKSAPAVESTPIVDIPGQVTNRSWAPTGGTPDANPTQFEEKKSNAKGWLSLAGSAVSIGLRHVISNLMERPVLGRVLNALDVGFDVAKLAGNLVIAPFSSKTGLPDIAKNLSDLAFHTAGVFNPKIGADYDKG